MQTRRLAQTLATVGLLVAAATVADGVKFHDLTYEEAATQAEAAEKIVLIDFFTTWCLPCKEMDRTTFQDPEVAAWLAEHAIALKVDAEENETNEALAARFGVKSFPNYVYLTPKGELLDRITGKKNSEEFIELSASVIAGDNAVIRARRALATRSWLAWASTRRPRPSDTNLSRDSTTPRPSTPWRGPATAPVHPSKST